MLENEPRFSWNVSKKQEIEQLNTIAEEMVATIRSEGMFRHQKEELIMLICMYLNADYRIYKK